MSTIPIILEGTVTADGTLEVPEKLSLPPGRVRVTVEPVEKSASGGLGVLEVLAQIHQGQAERGFQGRTGEEIDADVNALRDEWEERMEEIERLQEQGRQKRE